MKARHVRWMLTGGMLVGVYSETGPFTVIFALLVTLAIELNAWRDAGGHWN